MVLPPQDAADFLSLYSSLIAFAAGCLGGVAGISDFKSIHAAQIEGVLMLVGCCSEPGVASERRVSGTIQPKPEMRRQPVDLEMGYAVGKLALLDWSK